MVIPGRSTRVWFILLCTIVDALFLVALVIGAVVIGRPLSYLHCAGIPSIIAPRRRGDSNPDATAAYILVMRLNQYLTHVDADVGYGENAWDGVSGSKSTCLEAKAVWGSGIGLWCVLSFSPRLCPLSTNSIVSCSHARRYAVDPSGADKSEPPQGCKNSRDRPTTTATDKVTNPNHPELTGGIIATSSPA